MDRNTIEKKLRSIISARMPDKPDPSSIPADIPVFQNGLGLDSMSGIELVSEIEKHFQVYIDDDHFDIFDSLQKMIDFVAERVKRKNK